MRLPHAIAMLLAGCAIAIAGTAWSRQPLRLIVPAPPGGTCLLYTSPSPRD